MLTDPSLALQKALIARLLGDGPLRAIVGDRVLDKLPRPPTYPCVTIGEIQIAPVSGEGLDSVEAIVTVHTWDQYTSAKAARGVSQAVIAALHDEDLVIDGSRVLSVLLQDSRTLRDPDGLTVHGVQTFSVLSDGE